MRIASSKEKYLTETFGLRDPEMDEVKAELLKHNVDFMSIASNEARLLQFFIRTFQVKKIVEVGTLFGYSALCMAKALPENGELHTVEFNPTNFEIAKNIVGRSSQGSKIHFYQGKGTDVLPTLEAKGPFDLVFIDADKGGYADYLTWAEKNVRPGGLIVGDNTFLFGALWGESRDPNQGEKNIRVMTEFNRRLSDPKMYNSILIPTSEGMTVAQKL